MKPIVILKILVAVLGLIIVGLLAVLFFYNPAKAPPGGPEGPAVPVTIATGDGTLAVSPSSLQPNMVVTSPLPLEGVVRGGGWFFEGTFPIEIVDANGTIIGSTTARAEGDWMTTDTVAWTALLPFAPPAYSTSGLVLFKNDNPSGGTSTVRLLQVPVRFAQ